MTEICWLRCKTSKQANKINSNKQKRHSFLKFALVVCVYRYIGFIGTRDLFNISYSRELYLFSKFLHFEEIVRVKMAVCFEMIVSET